LSIFHISIRINCNRISEGLLYHSLIQRRAEEKCKGKIWSSLGTANVITSLLSFSGSCYCENLFVLYLMAPSVTLTISYSK
jgi:hypothetical protein